MQTTRGAIRAKKVGIVVAGRSGQVAAMAGMRLPIESHILQAFVTEGLKPVIDHVVSFGMGHFYISQSDKGGLVFGGDLDFYASYARAGQPADGRARDGGGDDADADDRQGAGAAVLGRDHGHDARRLADHRPDAGSRGSIIDCGWCYGGFKAVPGSGLCLRASDRDGPPARAGGAVPAGPVPHRAGLMDEEGTGAQHNLH